MGLRDYNRHRTAVMFAVGVVLSAVTTLSLIDRDWATSAGMLMVLASLFLMLWSVEPKFELWVKGRL